MTLRPATPEDASVLAALSIEVWVGTYLKSGIEPVFAEFVLGEFTPARCAAFIADPAQHTIVSENSAGRGGIDGYVRLCANAPAPFAPEITTEIATLYVQPRHHGRGIGRALLNAAFDHCRSTKTAALWLATNSENSPAIRFYQRMGFAPAGQINFTIDGTDYPNDAFTFTL